MFGSLRRNRITSDPDDPCAKQQRQRMVENQIRARGISDERVLQALRTVPRHLFVPADQRQDAYADRALAIAGGQTISQPYIVALMTEALQLSANDKVLEIGAGSGYQAAILARLTPGVYTIEIIESLLESARAAWRACGLAERIVSKIGDGSAGWPEHAPYDAITVTCAPASVPDALKQQLAIGGRLCIPVGGSLHSQVLIVMTREAEDSFSHRTLIPVRFVPMTGQMHQRA